MNNQLASHPNLVVALAQGLFYTAPTAPNKTSGSANTIENDLEMVEEEDSSAASFSSSPESESTSGSTSGSTTGSTSGSSYSSSGAVVASITSSFSSATALECELQN